jgi:site-specific recombinase XerD
MASENSLTGIDIHDYAGMLRGYLKKVESSNKISPENKQKILEYHRSLVNDGLAVPTRVKQLQVLNVIAERLQSQKFQDLTRKDIEELVFWIRSEKHNPWTVHKFLVIIRKFYKWLRGGEDYPPEVKWIKSNVKDSQCKLPENLLSQEDVKKLLNACENPRDKCLLSLLNELGCRIGELLTLDIKQIEDCQDYFRVTIQHSKTQPRKLKVIDSKPFIAQWLNKHSKLQGPNSPLFIGLGSSNKNQRLDYDACRMLLKKIAKRAGIIKAVNPHHWRHSTATRYANFMSYSQLCHWFGWKIGSKTASIYIHLSGQDLDSVVDEMRGKVSIKKFEDTLCSKICQQCGKENLGTDDLCEQCGAALTISGVLLKEDRLKQFESEMKARQKVLEEYVYFQTEKMKKMEQLLSDKVARGD